MNEMHQGAEMLQEILVEEMSKWEDEQAAEISVCRQMARKELALVPFSFGSGKLIRLAENFWVAWSDILRY